MVKTIHTFAIIFYNTSLITAFAFASNAVIVKHTLKKDAAAILETPNLTQVAEKSR